MQNIGFKEDLTHEFKSDRTCLSDGDKERAQAQHRILGNAGRNGRRFAGFHQAASFSLAMNFWTMVSTRMMTNSTTAAAEATP